LQVGSEIYSDSECTHLLGIIACNNHDYVLAEGLFQSALESGNMESQICLAELYSPAEAPHWEGDNPILSANLFQHVLLRDPHHPFALFGMAKLYLHGRGMEQDISKAKELYRHALEIDPHLPAINYENVGLLEWQENEDRWVYLLIPAIALMGAAIIYTAVRNRRPVL
jgi:hypothetical protein